MPRRKKKLKFRLSSVARTCFRLFVVRIREGLMRRMDRVRIEDAARDVGEIFV